MIKFTAIKNCETNCKKFKHWVLFSYELTKNKRNTNREIRNYLSSFLGEEGIRWELQGAGDQYILKLKDQRDYTFLLLRSSKH